MMGFEDSSQEPILSSLHDCYGRLGGSYGPDSVLNASSCISPLKPCTSAHPPILKDLEVNLRKPRRLSEIIVSKNHVMPPLIPLPKAFQKGGKRRLNPHLLLQSKQIEIPRVFDGLPHACGASRALPSEVALARHNLGSLDGAHLRDPALGGQHLPNRAELIRGVAGDAYVVGALKDELDVAYLENLGAALLGIVARRVQKSVHKGVGQVKDRLQR